MWAKIADSDFCPIFGKQRVMNLTMYSMCGNVMGKAILRNIYPILYTGTVNKTFKTNLTKKVHYL